MVKMIPTCLRKSRWASWWWIRWLVGFELLWYHYIEVQNTLWYLFVLRMCWNYKGIPKYVKPSIFIRVHALSLKLGEGYSLHAGVAASDCRKESWTTTEDRRCWRCRSTTGSTRGSWRFCICIYMGINNQSQSKFNTEIQTKWYMWTMRVSMHTVFWPCMQEVSGVNPYMEEEIQEEAEDTVPATCLKFMAGSNFFAQSIWAYYFLPKFSLDNTL